MLRCEIRLINGCCLLEVSLILRYIVERVTNRQIVGFYSEIVGISPGEKPEMTFPGASLHYKSVYFLSITYRLAVCDQSVET